MSGNTPAKKKKRKMAAGPGPCNAVSPKRQFYKQAPTRKQVPQRRLSALLP